MFIGWNVTPTNSGRGSGMVLEWLSSTWVPLLRPELEGSWLIDRSPSLTQDD